MIVNELEGAIEGAFFMPKIVIWKVCAGMEEFVEFMFVSVIFF